jgi:hypothetical protein
MSRRFYGSARRASSELDGQRANAIGAFAGVAFAFRDAGRRLGGRERCGSVVHGVRSPARPAGLVTGAWMTSRAIEMGRCHDACDGDGSASRADLGRAPACLLRRRPPPSTAAARPKPRRPMKTSGTMAPKTKRVVSRTPPMSVLGMFALPGEERGFVDLVTTYYDS